MAFWQVVALNLFILADNPYALKELDKAEDFDVNRSAAFVLQLNLSTGSVLALMKAEMTCLSLAINQFCYFTVMWSV